MFPTLSHLLRYLTGADVRIPIQTFGLFMALAFWAAYVAFREEFKRKEREGSVLPFRQETLTGAQQAAVLALYALTGFLLGYKIVYIFGRYSGFLSAPAYFLFSTTGSLIGGLITAAIFVGWRLMLRSLGRNTGETAEPLLIYPHQQVDRLMFWCAVLGFAGALLFSKLEFIADLFRDPLQWLITHHGLTFYGGFIFGSLTYLWITVKRMGIRLIHAMDIGSPGMMLAYGVGRIGCHLSGDGDWGIVNTSPAPAWIPQWAWASDFPHNVDRQGIALPDCAELYCNVLPLPVYPTSLYEAVICILLFVFLWMMKPLMKKGGVMFFTFILLNGIERFSIEFIKVNLKHCVGTICLSQAQWIALGFMITGLTGLMVKWKKP